MTEDEAKTKWCPMVRWSGGPDIKLTNREGKGGFGVAVTCIGSDCMMWRWDGDSRVEDCHGHCGLGGKP